MVSQGMDQRAEILRMGTAVLIFGRALAQVWLERLNRKSVLAHADCVPDSFKGVMDEATFRKSNSYTLAKGWLHQIEIVLDAIVLAVVLFSGVLPWFYDVFTAIYGTSAPALATFLFVVGMLLSFVDLPLSWYAQFGLEQQFGFNTTTRGTWWLDRIKGLILAIVIGYPLLVLLLKIVEWMGSAWWLWAWGALMVFQLIIAVLAPVLIMPLFNKFSPLHAVSHPQHSAHGRQQTFPPFQRVLHRVWPVPENCSVRHAGRATDGIGIGSGPGARDRPLQEEASDEDAAFLGPGVAGRPFLPGDAGQAGVVF
jgi:hypothetical protein